MKSIGALVAFVVFGLLSTGVADDQARGGGVEKLGFNVLRARTTGGFLEYEFYPDGKLISYEYLKDGTDSGPDIVDSSFSSKFRIEFLQWKIEDKIIYIYRGNFRSKSEIWSDEKYVYFNELVWLKVRHLEFFDELSRFTGKTIILK